MDKKRNIIIVREIVKMPSQPYHFYHTLHRRGDRRVLPDE